MNVVICKTNALGDNVVFLPVVQLLRRRFPQWQLGLITHPGLRELYAADVAPADLLPVAPDALRTAWRHPWRLLRWHRWIQTRRPAAMLVSYDQSTMAHLLARLSPATVRVGARFGLPWRRFGLTHPVEWRPGWNFAQWHWEMARALIAALGGGDIPASPPPPDLRHLTLDTLRLPRRIVIHPGSKTAMNRWPVERYAALATGLASRGWDVVWVCSPEMPHPPPAAVQGVTTANLGDLVRLLASASLFIGNNSGPMHLASALGAPSVVVSGRSPREWDPAWHQEQMRVLRRPELACQPCERHDWLPPACTHAAEPLACLQRWSAPAVEAACLELLSSATGRAPSLV